MSNNINNLNSDLTKHILHPFDRIEIGDKEDIIQSKELKRSINFNGEKDQAGEILNEQKCILLNFASVFFFSFANFQFNYISKHYDFMTPNIMVTLRSFWMTVTSLIMLYFRGREFPQISTVKEKFWLFVRCSINYFFFYFMILGFGYLRFSTMTCLFNLNPVFVVLFAVVILNEKFRYRYIIGIIICFLGASLLIFNDKSSKYSEISTTNEDSDIFNTLIGVIFGLLTATCLALILIGVKILTKEDIDQDHLLFYLGSNNFTIGFIHIIFIGQVHKLFTSTWCVLYMLINSTTSYMGLYCLQWSYKNIDMGKLTSIGYIGIIISFILGAIFLNESFDFIDILGSLIIFSYNIYNAYYPVEKDE